MLRPARRPPFLLLAAIGLAVGLVAAGLLSVPRVTAVQPPDQSTGISALPAISVAFSQAMRADTVEGRFHIEPARPGTFRWSGAEMTFVPLQPWSEGEEVTVALESGALSLRGLPTFAATSWSFTIGAGRLAYLWPANEAAGLYAWSPAAEEPQTLIEADGGVIDFNLSADGSAVVYSVSTESGSDIRLAPLAGGEDILLHRCPDGTTCRAASLSPDGRLLAYLQEEAPLGGTTLRRVWVKAVPDGPGYTIAPDDHATSQPVWSSRGWLAIYDQTLRGYALYSQVEEQQARLDFMVPNELGETPAWSPDGEHLVFTEMLFLPETSFADEDEPPRYYSHLNRVSIVDGRQIDLSGEQALLVEDAGPAYSPDGAWIAFSRRHLDPTRWTLGRQLWIMAADGSQPLQLTDTPALNHAGLAWSPDGLRLAYMLFDQARAEQPSEVWWMWADGRPGSRIVAGGYAPEWIP
jgi:hypothetical protein